MNFFKKIINSIDIFEISMEISKISMEIIDFLTKLLRIDVDILMKILEKFQKFWKFSWILWKFYPFPYRI